MLRKITIIQSRTGRRLARDEVLLVFKQRPDFVVLPEYYNVDPANRDPAWNASLGHGCHEYCRVLSERLSAVVISGTGIEINDGHFYNSCCVYDRGCIVGRYRKIHPTERECRHGISPGADVGWFEVDGVRFSVLICADVFHPELFAQLRAREPDIVFVPTTSPFRPGETIAEKFARDQNLFVAGARTAGSYVVKCCAVGELWGGSLQGRSLVAAPWGIITRIMPDQEDRERILSVTLDIADLRDFRRKQAAQGQQKI
jgi:predicted amidohydrolase